LAAPWTISRDRQDTDAGTAPHAAFSPARTRSWRTLTGRLAGKRPVKAPGPATSCWPGRPPGQPPPAGPPAPAASQDRAAKRVISGRPAVTLLAAATAAALLLGWATVSIAERGIAGGQAAARRTAGPLVIPAPKSAGGLPRRFGSIGEPGTGAIVIQLRLRFGAVGYGLTVDARKAAQARTKPGTPPSKITAAWTSGLYGQPGHLDPDTNKPAWVMYLGLNATARLGAPADTVNRLMVGILGPYAKIGPWRVNAGHRGGAANCTVAWLGQTMVGVCGWATDRSIGALASPIRDTSVAELATLMIRMRYELQRR
jgi:hypothetical protein